MYIGNMVQGKRKSHFYNGMPAERVKREDWIVVENTHEPIISREVFDEVQKNNTRRSYKIRRQS